MRTWRPLERIGRRHAKPTEVTSAPGDHSRLFVVEKTGAIRLIKDGVVQPEPFLDLRSHVYSVSEAGLLSLAFAPDYQRTRRFYVVFVTQTATSA